MHYVAELFIEKPNQWGLRGDPYLWRELQVKYETVSIPYDSELFEREIYDYVKQFFMDGFDETKIVKVERFAHGGMSSGGLSAEFWIKHGIPTLKKRLMDMNR